MKISTEIVELAAENVCDYYEKHFEERFAYHNLSHTIQVVEGVDRLCEKLNVNEHQRKILQVAAWFHDTGYLKQIEGHEIASGELAETFLKSYHISEEEISLVKSCILATRYPQRPNGRLEQILCDADLMHIADGQFFALLKNLRLEILHTQGTEFSDEQWLIFNIKFLSQHHFHTGYGRQKLQKGKEQNLQALKEQLKQTEEPPKKIKQKNESVQVKETGTMNKLLRGAEAFFKIGANNHMRLSAIADNKAQILLSINTIIISVVFSFLATEKAKATYWVIPLILLMTTSLITILFAVLTTQPKLSGGVFTKEQIQRREVNLLFFGDFHKMDLKAYESGVEEVIKDRRYLYQTFTKDIFFQGKVLASKYRHLNIAYKIFMYGLTASVVVFGICLIVTGALH
jgi:predicted metal-dependent HD superfamily phosphohydrolase